MDHTLPPTHLLYLLREKFTKHYTWITALSLSQGGHNILKEASKPTKIGTAIVRINTHHSNITT